MLRAPRWLRTRGALDSAVTADGRASGGQPELPSLARQLRRLRQRAALSQEELAARAGVSVSTIRALEEAQRRRSHPHTLVALADALGLSNNERAGLLELASRSSAQTEAMGPTPTRSEDSRPNTPPVPMPIIRMATQRHVRVRLPVPPDASHRP
jgi:transcriptional regulator with XRE-family HTH domain